jgi:hypothetical protein
MDRIRVQCQECGGFSTILSAALRPRRVLNCTRCHVLTRLWSPIYSAEPTPLTIDG